MVSHGGSRPQGVLEKEVRQRDENVPLFALSASLFLWVYGSDGADDKPQAQVLSIITDVIPTASFH